MFVETKMTLPYQHIIMMFTDNFVAWTLSCVWDTIVSITWLHGGYSLGPTGPRPLRIEAAKSPHPRKFHGAPCLPLEEAPALQSPKPIVQGAQV